MTVCQALEPPVGFVDQAMSEPFPCTARQKPALGHEIVHTAARSCGKLCTGEDQWGLDEVGSALVTIEPPLSPIMHSVVEAHATDRG